MVEQFRHIFSTIFDCYASLRDKQHMVELDFLSLCYDFCLVPDLVPRHEVHRVYFMVECLDKHPAHSLASSLTSDLSNLSMLSVPSRSSGIRAHTHTDVRTQGPIYWYLPTDLPTDLPTYLPTHVRTSVRTHTHTYIPTDIALMHLNSRTFAHKYMCMPEGIYTYMHTFPQTHNCTPIHLYIWYVHRVKRF